MEPTAKLAGEAGTTAIEDNFAEDVVVGVVEVVDVLAVTVKLTDGLVMPDKVTVILAVPAATPVAKPDEEMVAIVLSELAQVNGDVMSDVMPFERVPTALNSWEDPTAKLSGDAGVIARPVNVATGNITAGLVIPDTVAVILAVPAATPVAKPAEDIVAILVSELAQVTFPVMSAVEPSEYVPEAANCSVRPTAKLSGVPGVTAMEDNV